MSRSQEKSTEKQGKERSQKVCLSEATRSILEAVCNDFQNIGVPDNAEKSGQVSILSDEAEESNEEPIGGIGVNSVAVSKSTDCEKQVYNENSSSNEEVSVSNLSEEQVVEDENYVSAGTVKLIEKYKENVVQCNSHSSFNVTDASENSQMDFAGDEICKIIDGNAVAGLNLLTISAEIIEKNVTGSSLSSVVVEDGPQVNDKVSKNVLNAKSSISASALNSVPNKTRKKVAPITAVINQPRIGLPIKVRDDGYSQRTKLFHQNKSIAAGKKAAVLKMSQTSKPARKVPHFPPRAERYSHSRSTLKARRISAKMKQAWALQLQKDGHLTCPVPGCNQSYVTVANLITHYKWCSGKKSLQHCTYCSSLIIADQDAVLHHIKVEHPEKLEEYKEKLPVKHLVERQEDARKNDLASCQELPSGKTCLHPTFGNCVAKTLSKKYQRLNKHSKAKLRAKENILKPRKTCLKKKAKPIDEEEPCDKKCVRFNDIVEKIKSVEDKPAEQPDPGTTTVPAVCNTLFPGILENAFLPEEVTDDILDITECEGLPPTNYFDLSDEENVDDFSQSSSAEAIAQKKSHRLKVLDTHGFKRFSEYLKLTRDWASERRTYSRSKHGASADSPAVPQPAAAVEDVADVHQLHDTPEPSKISLGASETELTENEITPYCNVTPEEPPDKESPIFDNLVSRLSDKETANRLSAVGTEKSIPQQSSANTSCSEKQGEIAVSGEHPNISQNNSSSTGTSLNAHLTNASPGYKSPVAPKSYRPLIKVRVTCYDNACKEDSVQNTSPIVEKTTSTLSKPVSAKSPITLDKTVASLCKSLQTPPPVPDFDSLIKGCVPSSCESTHSAGSTPKKKRGRPPKNSVQQSTDLVKQLSDAVLNDGVKKTSAVANQALSENLKKSGNAANPALGDSGKKAQNIRENGIKLPPGNTVVDGVVVKKKRGRPKKNTLLEQFPKPQDTLKTQGAVTESVSTSSRKIVHKCKWCADCDTQYTKVIKRKRNSAKALQSTQILPQAESLTVEQLAAIDALAGERVLLSQHPAFIKYFKSKKVICSKKVKCKGTKLQKMARKPRCPKYGFAPHTQKVDAATQVSQDIDLNYTTAMESKQAGSLNGTAVNVTNICSSVNAAGYNNSPAQNETEVLNVNQFASLKQPCVGELTMSATNIPALPKKRGRPRKNVSPNEVGEQQTPLNNMVCDGAVVSQASQITPRRRRGRPRKNPLATVNLHVANALTNQNIHDAGVVVTSDKNQEKMLIEFSEGQSPEKDTVGENFSNNVAMNDLSLNTEMIDHDRECANGPKDCMQVFEASNKSNEILATVVPDSNVVENAGSETSSVANTVISLNNNQTVATSLCDDSPENKMAQDGKSVGSASAVVVHSGCTLVESTSNSMADQISNLDTNYSVEAEQQINQREESVSAVIEVSEVNSLTHSNNSDPIATSCESVVVAKTSTTAASSSNVSETEGISQETVNSGSTEAIQVDNSAVLVSDTLQEVKIAQDHEDVSKISPMDSPGPTSENALPANPHESTASASVEQATSTSSSISTAVSVPNDCIKEITDEIATPNSSSVLNTSADETKTSDGPVSAEDYSSNVQLVQEETPKGIVEENVLEVNSSANTSLNIDSPSAELQRKTGKRGRPRKHPVGEKGIITPVSSASLKKESSNASQQKVPLRTSSRQRRSSRKLCIDDTCMDESHRRFHSPNLKSSFADSESVLKSRAKYKQSSENISDTPYSVGQCSAVESLKFDEKGNENVDAANISTPEVVGRSEDVKDRGDSCTPISDVNAVEAEVSGIIGVNKSHVKNSSKNLDGLEVTDPNLSSGVAVKKTVESSHLLSGLHKVARRRGRPRKYPQKVGNSTTLTARNMSMSANMQSSKVVSSGVTGSSAFNTAAANSARKCSRKGLPRKCVRYAVINSGVDSDTLEDESLGVNSQEEEKRTRKKARLDRNKSNTSEDKTKSNLSEDKNKLNTSESKNELNTSEGKNKLNTCEDEDKLNNSEIIYDQSSGKQLVKTPGIGELCDDVNSNALEQKNDEETVHMEEREENAEEEPQAAQNKSKTGRTSVSKMKGKKRKRETQKPADPEVPSTRVQTKGIHMEVESDRDPEQKSGNESDLTPPFKKRKLTRRAAVKARKMMEGLIAEDKNSGSAEVSRTKGESKDHDYEAASDEKSENESEPTEYAIKVELAKYKKHYVAPRKVTREVPPDLFAEWCKLLAKGKKIICGNKGCGKAFKSKIGIRDHYINSTCQRRWKCLKCNKLTNGPRSMLRHMRKNHFEPVRPKDRESKRTSHSTTRKLSLEFGAIQWTMDFYKKHSYNDLMPEWKPKKSLWKLQDFRAYEGYLPPLKTSVKIGVECANKNSKKWFSLNCFESAPVDVESSHCTFFTGGPIWSAAWCPTPFEVEAEQYIALATANRMDSDHRTMPATEGKGLLQLWSLGKLNKNIVDCKPVLSLAIPHNYGTVWDMSWCPVGCWENPSNNTHDEILPRLGLLAVACSDSSVYIYSIPHPSSLNQDTNCLPIFAAHPSVQLCCDYGEPCLIARKSLCTSISWQRTDSCELIAGGFSNGMIRIWHLTSTSSLLMHSNGDIQKKITPFLSFPAHSAAITGVSFAGLPGGRWLASCGFDRVAKVWDLEDISLPVSNVHKKLVRSVQWITHWNGLFITKDDTSSATVYKECGYYNYAPRLLVPHNAGIWSCSVSEWLNTVVSCDAAGEVAGSVLCHLLKNVDSIKQLHDRRFPIFRTEMRPLEENSAFLGQRDGEEINMDEDSPENNRQGDVNCSQNNLDVLAVSASVVNKEAVILQTVEDILQSVVQQDDNNSTVMLQNSTSFGHQNMKSDHNIEPKSDSANNCDIVAQCYDEISIGESSKELSMECSEKSDGSSCQDVTDVKKICENAVNAATVVVQTVEDILQKVVHQYGSNAEIICQDGPCDNENGQDHYSMPRSPDGVLVGQHDDEEMCVDQGLEQLSAECSKQINVESYHSDQDVSTTSASVINAAASVVQLVEDIVQNVVCHDNSNSEIIFLDTCDRKDERADDCIKPKSDGASHCVDQRGEEEMCVGENVDQLSAEYSKQIGVKECHSDQDVSTVSASVISDAASVVQMVEDIVQTVVQHNNSEIIFQGRAPCDNENDIDKVKPPEDANNYGQEISVDESVWPTSVESSEQSGLHGCQSSMDVSNVINDAAVIVQTVEDLLQNVQHRDSNSEIILQSNVSSDHESVGVDGNGEKSRDSEIGVGESLKLLSTKSNEQSGVNTCQNDLDMSLVSADVISEATVIIQTMEDILKNVHHCDSNSETGFQGESSCSHENGKSDQYNKAKSPGDQHPSEINIDGSLEKPTKCKELGNINSYQSDLSVSAVSANVMNEVIIIVQTVQDMLKNLQHSSEINFQNFVSGDEKGNDNCVEQSETQLSCFQNKTTTYPGSKHSVSPNVIQSDTTGGIQCSSEIIQDCRFVLRDICQKIENRKTSESDSLNEVCVKQDKISDVTQVDSLMCDEAPNNVILCGHDESKSSTFIGDFVADSNTVFSVDLIEVVQEMVNIIATNNEKNTQNIVFDSCENSGYNKKTGDTTTRSAEISSDIIGEPFSKELLMSCSTEAVEQNISAAVVCDKQTEKASCISQSNLCIALEILNDIIKKVENLHCSSSICDTFPESCQSGSIEGDMNSAGALNKNLYEAISSVLNSVLMKVTDMQSYCDPERSGQNVQLKSTLLEPGGISFPEHLKQPECCVTLQNSENFEESNCLERREEENEDRLVCHDEALLESSGVPATINCLASDADDEDMMEFESMSPEDNSCNSMELDEYSDLGSIDFIVVDEATCEIDDDDSCIESKENSLDNCREKDSDDNCTEDDVVKIPCTVNDLSNSADSHVLEPNVSELCPNMETIDDQEPSFIGEGDHCPNVKTVCNQEQSFTDEGDISEPNVVDHCPNVEMVCNQEPSFVGEGDISEPNVVGDHCPNVEMVCNQEPSFIGEGDILEPNVVGDDCPNVEILCNQEPSFIGQGDSVIPDTNNEVPLCSDSNHLTDLSSKAVLEKQSYPPTPDQQICSRESNEVRNSTLQEPHAVKELSVSVPEDLNCVKQAVENIVSHVANGESSMYVPKIISNDEFVEASVHSVQLQESIAATRNQEDTIQCVEEIVEGIISTVSCSNPDVSEKDLCNTCSLGSSESDVVNDSAELPSTNMVAAGAIEASEIEQCGIETQTKVSGKRIRLHSVTKTEDSNVPQPKKLKMASSDEELILCENDIISNQNTGLLERTSVDNFISEDQVNITDSVNNRNSSYQILPSSSSGTSESCAGGSVIHSESNLGQDLCGSEETNNSDPLDKYENISRRYGLFFKDADLRNFQDLPESETMRLKKSDTMTPAIPDKYDLASVNTVKWNPNYGSHLWLFTGGQAGIARLSLVKALNITQKKTPCTKPSKKPQQKR